jgi:hypothetical protein
MSCSSQCSDFNLVEVGFLVANDHRKSCRTISGFYAPDRLMLLPWPRSLQRLDMRVTGIPFHNGSSLSCGHETHGENIHSIMDRFAHLEFGICLCEVVPQRTKTTDQSGDTARAGLILAVSVAVIALRFVQRARGGMGHQCHVQDLPARARVRTRTACDGSFSVAKIGLKVASTTRRPRRSVFGLHRFLAKQKPPCLTVVSSGCRDRI